MELIFSFLDYTWPCADVTRHEPAGDHGPEEEQGQSDHANDLSSKCVQEDKGTCASQENGNDCGRMVRPRYSRGMEFFLYRVGDMKWRGINLWHNALKKVRSWTKTRVDDVNIENTRYVVMYAPPSPHPFYPDCHGTG